MAEGTCLGLGLTQSKELVAHIIFVYGKFEFICILCTLSQICCLFVLKEKINLKKQIERVQRTAAIYVVNDYNYTSSVTEILKTFNWQTLEQRRIQNSLVMLCKINYNLVTVDHHHLTEIRNLNFLVSYSRTQYHMNEFFPIAVRYWNTLPYCVKASTSLDKFTAGLASIHF